MSTAAQLQRQAQRATVDAVGAAQQASRTTHPGDARILRQQAAQSAQQAQQYTQAAQRQARREEASY